MPVTNRLISAHVVLETRVVTGAGGGPEKTILNSPRFLHGTGYRTLCAYMRPPEDRRFEELRRRAKQWQAPLFEIEDRGPWDWQVAMRFLQICRRERVSIWHGHDYKSNALGLLLSRFWPMRLVTTLHGWVKHTRRTPVYYYLDRLCLPRYEKVICVSQDLYEAALDQGVAPGRCVLIENAIDTDEFTRQRTVEEAKNSRGIPAGRLTLGFVGRLSAEKGLDILVQAVDRLLQRGFDLELFIGGDGEEKQRLTALIARLGRAERIHLLGYLPNVKEFYEGLDIFALASLREGLPNVLLEALALEVPVVATRIAGIPRLITNGITGLLAEPGSVDDLEKQLSRLALDANLRRQLSGQGRDVIARFYGFDARMQKIRGIYDDLLGKPAA